MTTVCFVNPKGGVGKTTSALLFAEYCSEQNLGVTVLDLDPNANLVLFGQTRKDRGEFTPFNIQGRPDDIDDVIDVIEDMQSKSDVLVVDLEGSRDKIATLALSQSDLAVIPMNGSAMEARQAAAAIKLIKSTEKMINSEIAQYCLFTRVNAGIAWTDERQVREELEGHGLNMFKNRLEMRSPFTQIFRDSALLSELVKMSEGQGQQTAAWKKFTSAKNNASNVSKEITMRLMEAVK